MTRYIADSARGGRASFRKVVETFLAGEGLPFAQILSAERIQRVFVKHDGLFGLHGVYTTAIMVWSFLGQVLRDGKEASCQAAVARVVCYCEHEQISPPTADTGDYCRARAKLSEAALHELSCEVAEEAQTAAEKDWLWKGKHAKLIDGFTFTMPDTALLREIFDQLNEEDIAVMDRYYCSFMMIALLLAQGTQVCTRKHQRRHSDFRRGRRLGKYDHIIVWTRPVRPEWMDEATYEQIPETLELREIRYWVVEPGRRTRSIDVITTLTDAEQYTKEDIAQLYGFRWNSELDIRSIKDSLNLGYVRCKSPEMVRCELWTTMLGYRSASLPQKRLCYMANSRVRSASRARANMCWRRGCRSRSDWFPLRFFTNIA